MRIIPENQLLLRILAAMEDNCESLSWVVDRDTDEVKFFIGCNDCMAMAADAVDIDETNINILEDTMAQFGRTPMVFPALLFCCRACKLRPMLYRYENIPERYHHLYDACGPERSQ